MFQQPEMPKNSSCFLKISLLVLSILLVTVSGGLLPWCPAWGECSGPDRSKGDGNHVRGLVLGELVVGGTCWPKTNSYLPSATGPHNPHITLGGLKFCWTLWMVTIQETQLSSWKVMSKVLEEFLRLPWSWRISKWGQGCSKWTEDVFSACCVGLPSFHPPSHSCCLAFASSLSLSFETSVLLTNAGGLNHL